MALALDRGHQVGGPTVCELLGLHQRGPGGLVVGVVNRLSRFGKALHRIGLHHEGPHAQGPLARHLGVEGPAKPGPLEDHVVLGGRGRCEPVEIQAVFSLEDTDALMRLMRQGQL